MPVWAANHPNLAFIDVTKECETLHGVVMRNCSLVEVWITTRDPTLGGMEAATATPEIVSNPDESLGLDDPFLFRYTNGEYSRTWDPAEGKWVPRRVIETIGGVIAFGGRQDSAAGGSLCWYLDSTFCSSFHLLKKVADPETVKIAGLVCNLGD